MKNDDRVHFQFKSLSNSNIGYDAGYSPPTHITDNQHCLDLTQTPQMFPHFYRGEAWNIFRNNATFDDILKGTRGSDILDVIHELNNQGIGKPDFFNYDKWSDIKFLKELSQWPDWLDFSETGALTRFIFMVRVAGEANSGKSKECALMLKDYFIPKRPGSNKAFPVNLNGCLYLLCDLADHISKECRSFLSDGDISDEYNELQKWANGKEPRILETVLDSLPFKKPPQYKLALLTKKPHEFAETILAGELYMSRSKLKQELYK